MALYLLEADIEHMIFNNKDHIHERGFVEFLDVSERQFRLPSGKIIDIVTYRENEEVFHFKIIELKRGIINIQTFEQAINYCHEFLIPEASKKVKEIQYEIILCGSEIDPTLENVIYLGCNVQAYLYEFNYNGLSFRKVFDRDYKPNAAVPIKEVA